jgi:DNA modification methylase
MPMDSRVIQGDAVEEMRKMDENSIDAIVCDPPY